MGIRVVLQEGESLAEAMRRLKKLLARDDSIMRQRLRRPFRFLDKNWVRRIRKYRKRYRSRQATLQDQQSGMQPVGSLAEAIATFRRRQGYP
jgi:hypothetical protein